MATLEELRKKRLQESQRSSLVTEFNSEKKQQSSLVNEFNNRSKKNKFIDSTENVQTSVDVNSASEAFKLTATVNTLPILGGIASGAAAGSFLPGVGTLVGAIVGGITGAVLTKKAQDEVLEFVKGEEWKRNLDQTLAEDRVNHPYATLAGEGLPALITFKPSRTTLKQAFDLSKRALTDPKSLAKHTNTLEGKVELDALVNVGVGAGVDVSLETYQQIREGDINALRILGSALIGGVISDPNRIGVKLGFSPTGDAVIEEYNQFGSKTPAAKVVTHGEVPLLDRSTDRLVIQRKELSSILRGESEKNRFTEPRILQAERIAGTIDRDVTPNSNLNVYRLDGRDGALRVGERVTANPHIADVFGGRINPETIVKAGDLVRTSQGDYVYIPKTEIQARPKLPPVTLLADKKIRTEVKNREEFNRKELKAKAREAIRIKEEPERLAKKALKQQEDIKAKHEKEIKENEQRAIRLEDDIKKTVAEKQQKIAEDNKRIKIERSKIDKTKDKEILSIETIKRKALNEALLEHTDRVVKLKTPKQKVKEKIRFNNKKVKIKEKAKKAKKEVTQKAKEDKFKLKSKAKEIKSESNERVRNTKKRIKELRKTETIKKTTKKKVVKETVSAKKIVPVVEVKKTLIGSKEVESASLIKNAVKEARDNSEKAQELDENVTAQMGTTFVEQAKRSSEMLTERGLDDTLKFAIDATESELSNLGINRSALYQTLYKTVIDTEQFSKYRDKLETLAIAVSDEVSIAAQTSSLHRMATQNDPFRRVNALRKALIEREEKLRGTTFKKEVDDLNILLKEAGSLEDINKIIRDNLC